MPYDSLKKELIEFKDVFDDFLRSKLQTECFKQMGITAEEPVEPTVESILRQRHAMGDKSNLQQQHPILKNSVAHCGGNADPNNNASSENNPNANLEEHQHTFTHAQRPGTAPKASPLG